jgi:putative membrane protein
VAAERAMIGFLVRGLAAAGGFWIAARVVRHVHVDGYVSLALAGLVLGLLNAVVRPLLILLTLPLTILTFGLFLFVVNGLTVWLVTAFIHGVRIHGLWPAILTSVIISLASWLANGLIGALRNERD